MPTTRPFSAFCTLAASTIAAATLLTACASRNVPREELGASRAAIQSAQAEAGAGSAPEMALAREKLAQAEAAARAGNSVKAQRLAEEARVDAQVAHSKLDAENSRRAAQEIDASLATLREEMNRASPTTSAPVKP